MMSLTSDFSHVRVSSLYILPSSVLSLIESLCHAILSRARQFPEGPPKGSKAETLYQGVIDTPLGDRDLWVILFIGSSDPVIPEEGFSAGVRHDKGTKDISLLINLIQPVANLDYDLVYTTLYHEFIHVFDPKFLSPTLSSKPWTIPSVSGVSDSYDPTRYLTSLPEETAYTAENYTRLKKFLDQGKTFAQIEAWIRDYKPSPGSPLSWYEGLLYQYPQRWRRYKKNMHKILRYLVNVSR
jgi:hypothetical protein